MDGRKSEVVWRIVAVAALTVALLALTLNYFGPAPEGEAATAYGQCDVYIEQGCDKFIVADGGEIEVLSGGTLDVQSGATADFNAAIDMNSSAINDIGAAGTDFGADGSLTTAKGITISDGDLVVADWVRATAQTAITVTNGAAFTPTGTYQAIVAAGEVTPTITAGATDGNWLVLSNASAQTINVADSGTAKLSAAWAGGQYDVLVLRSDGTNWIEISRSNN